MPQDPKEILTELKQLEGNIVLRAGAGTGKTYTLTERVIHLITHKNCRIDQILALTFTDDAAAEMRERIYRRISSAIAETEDPEQKAHLIEQKRQFGRNFISTFHSFCRRLLEYYPDELAEISVGNGMENEDSEQLTAGFDILDSYTESIRQLEWQQDFLRHVKEDPSLKRLLLQYRFSDLTDFFTTFGYLEEHQLAELAELSPEQYLNIIRAIRQTVEKTVEREADQLNTLCRDWHNQFKEPPELPVDPIWFLSEGPTTKAGKLGKRQLTGSKEEKQAMVDAFQPVLDRLQSPVSQLQAIDDYLNAAAADPAALSQPPAKQLFDPNSAAYWLISDLANISHRWSRYMRYRRVQDGVLNFDDIIWFARALLQQFPRIALGLRSRFRHVLVDEFQDTDLRQWEIIRALSKGDNLLIVGDVKQAIYGFRGGDVTMMQRAVDELKTAGSDQQFHQRALSYSFRSTKPVVQFTNRLFRTLFNEKEDRPDYEAAPQDLSLPPIERPNFDADEGSVTLMRYDREAFELDEMDEADQELLTDGNRIEAERIALLLSEIMAGEHDDTYASIGKKLRNGQRAVGMLFHRRTHMETYEKALKARGLPFTVAGGRNFFQRQEIKDCYNMLCFLIDAFDDLALSGVLRSPFAGLSDLALLAISNARADGDADNSYPNFWQAVRHWQQWGESNLLPPDLLSLRSVVPILERLRTEIKHRRVSEVLEKAIYQTNYLAAAEDEQVVRNLHRLFAMVRDLERSGNGSLFEVVQFLKEQLDSEAAEKNAELPESGAITLMTVHSSKGLEFPMVILPDMNGSLTRGGFSSYTTPRDYKVAGQALIAAKSYDRSYEEGDESGQIIFGHLKKVDLDRERAENRRLFYVAVTRAVSHLLLCDTASYPRPSSSKYKNFSFRKPSSDGFSDLLQRWLEGDPQANRHITISPLTEAEVQRIAQHDENPREEEHQKPKPLLNSAHLNSARNDGQSVVQTVTRLHDDPDLRPEAFELKSQWQQITAAEAGTIIHKALELGVSDREFLTAHYRLKGYDAGNSSGGRDIETLQFHTKQALHWLDHQIGRPKRTISEVAFEWYDAQRNSYTRGTIDLLMQNQKNKWFLIDFKTAVPNRSQLTGFARAAGYGQQLRHYLDASLQLTGQQMAIRPERSLILFTGFEGGAAVSLSEIEKGPDNEASQLEIGF